MPTQVLVPPLGQTVAAVTLVSWHKAEGDSVTKGEMLFAIETDKATLDIESPASGVLRNVSAQPGDEIESLSTIALILADGEALPAVDLQVEPQPQRHRQVSVSASRTPAVKERGGNGRRIFISPRARRLAERHAVPLDALQPSGPEGAIVERDVRAYLDRVPSEEPAEPRITPVARRLAQQAGLDWRGLSGSGPAGRITRQDVVRASADADDPEDTILEEIPVRGVRAVIAQRMAHSAATTAAVTLNAEADATALVELRRELVVDGIQVSYNDLLLAILAKALREYPRLNASLDGDTIRVWKEIHIGLAVDTERGLLVPVVRNADQQGLGILAEKTSALVQRAQSGQCAPEELTGGTFTLTNLGMYGIDSFSPIINPPECAVLGVGRIKRQPVMVDDQVVGRDMVWLSLTFDHRLVDGAPAARFLKRVVQLLERPHLLMV